MPLAREIAEELQSRVDTATMEHVGTFETQRDYDGCTEFRMICYTADYTGPLVASREIAESDGSAIAIVRESRQWTRSCLTRFIPLANCLEEQAHFARGL